MTIEKLRKFKLGNKGFSLVELIIVIAIMAILIAVLAPMYLRYIERSRIGVDADAVGSIVQALKVAVLDPVIGTATSNITVTWQTDDGSGSFEVSGNGTTPGTGTYADAIKDAIEASVGNAVVPRSNAAQADDVTIVFDLNTGSVTASNGEDAFDDAVADIR